ncbi:hypothetical protein F8388_021076 [Cannabis sativa]|uniref:CCHC-type domain-containing protein n=1 Tax=Cannabis sativa TaxID=3483 RepID=A0A7J6GZ70_CANSA|nr:hypothetical protein G4B88_015972 [Cannabis sativa]KAF4388246.1 hypothetical protein F8388_021076 [Cannabis sativa]
MLRWWCAVDQWGSIADRWVSSVRVWPVFGVSAGVGRAGLGWLGFYLSITRGRREWIQFKYRKLPKFCFNCGHLGHDRSDCTREKEFAYPPVGNAVPLYGPWIKAAVPMRNCFDTKGPSLLRDRPERVVASLGRRDIPSTSTGPHEEQGSGACEEATIHDTLGEGTECTMNEAIGISKHSSEGMTSVETRSKKRKATGNVSPIIVIDSGKPMTPLKLKGSIEETIIRDVSPFSLGKNTPKKGSSGSRKLRNRKATNDKSYSVAAKTQGNVTICEGACTIIASGEEVDVWWQPWIPWLDYEEFRDLMESIRPKAPSIRCVADLMFRRTRKWNLGYLCFLFGPELGNRISTIQIDRNGDSDILIWKDSDVGRFSVKGAYWLDQKSRFGDSSKLWKWIWYSKIHPRLSLMIWRAISGSLPTGDRIFAVENNLCPLCHLVPETPVHLFCRCSFAVALWFSSPLPLRMDDIPGNSLSEVIFNLIALLDSEGRNRLLCCIGIVMDCIWKLRNSLLHSPVVGPNMDKIRRDICCRFNEMSDQDLGDYTPAPSRLSIPSFPEERSGKCLLVDGSFFGGKFGCAMVALELQSTNWWLGHSSGTCDLSLEAEMKAVLFGLQWAAAIGWDNFSIFSDAKILVEAINSKKSPHWKLSALFSSLMNFSQENSTTYEADNKTVSLEGEKSTKFIKN